MDISLKKRLLGHALIWCGILVFGVGLVRPIAAVVLHLYAVTAIVSGLGILFLDNAFISVWITFLVVVSLGLIALFSAIAN
jgi:hypothetical protein